MVWTRPRIAAASVSRTLRARARPSAGGGGEADGRADMAGDSGPASGADRDRLADRARLRRAGDRVERQQPRQGAFEAIEAQRVLAVALGPRRILVDLHEDPVDAGGDAGRGERLDVLRQAGGDAVAGARQLQAVRDVEDDRHA